MKFDIRVFFENLSRNFKFHLNPTRTTGTLNKDQCKFVIIFRSILLKMRNVSNKVKEKIKTHFLFSVTIFENHAVYEIMWINIVEPERPQVQKYGSGAFHAGYQRLKTHTQGICSTCGFFTSTLVAETLLNITLQYVACLVTTLSSNVTCVSKSEQPICFQNGFGFLSRLYQGKY